MVVKRLMKLRCIVLSYMFLVSAISILLFKVDYTGFWFMSLVDPGYDYSYMLVHKRISSPNLENDPYYWSLIYGVSYIWIWWFLCFSKVLWKEE